MPISQPLVDFGKQSVHSLIIVKLPVRMGEKGKGWSVLFVFRVVDIDLPYNVIIEGSTLKKLKAAISTYQLLLQLEADNGKIVQLFGNQKSA